MFHFIYAAVFSFATEASASTVPNPLLTNMHRPLSQSGKQREDEGLIMRLKEGLALPAPFT